MKLVSVTTAVLMSSSHRHLSHSATPHVCRASQSLLLFFFKLLVVCSSNILNKSLFHWQVDNEITRGGSVESGPRRAAGLSRAGEMRDEGYLF